MSTGSAKERPVVRRQILDSAGTPFAALGFVVPVAAAIVALALRDTVLLNLVHVLSGAIWAGATIYVAGVFGPTMLGLEPQVRGQVNAPMIPKNILLFAGVALASLGTGPVLAVRLGHWNLSDPYLLAALLIGAALLVGAVYLVWLQLNIFREIGTPGPPDGARVAALGKRLGMVSPVMLVLQLAILVDMSLLAMS